MHVSNQVKWFTDGAEFNSNHEMLIWLWSSTMADANYSCKFPFAALPMRWFPSKDLRAKANRAIVEIIAWDRISIQFVSFWLFANGIETSSNFTTYKQVNISTNGVRADL